MKLDGSTKHEAIEKCKSLIIPSYRIEKPIAVSPPVDLSRIATLTKYFETTLNSMKLSVPARTYAESRGLDVEKLQIGYCGAELGRKWNKNLEESLRNMDCSEKRQKTIALWLILCWCLGWKVKLDGLSMCMFDELKLIQNENLPRLQADILSAEKRTRIISSWSRECNSPSNSPISRLHFGVYLCDELANWVHRHCVLG